MAESSISVAVRIRPFSAKETCQLAPQDNYQPFLGDGGLSVGSPQRPPVSLPGGSGIGGSSAAPSLRTKFLRPIIQPVDDKVLIFDPPDNNPLTKLYNGGQNTFGHGNKKAKDVRYAFDRVFDGTCGQREVFENTTKPLLDGILNGYNASVFAYGATGCGKTHTISGTPDDPGVIFLTMKDLYERIELSREESEVQVRLSYLEIYNESIRDLLSPTPTPPGQGLMLREDAARKISVVGITEHVPESPERVLEMIQEGNLRRTMSPTEANAVSSRSHAVLQINITQRPRTADTITETTSASLNIIDLAGSERASATRNNGVRMKEGANINKSLLALGNCINALCQSGGQRNKHVPYRNSKLTRLLKFSLGGNCKTVMIVCVSPSSAHYDETHNTLKYANQAKNIRTKVSRNMLNVDRHVAQYVQAIHELRQEVSELKAKLASKAAVENASEKKRKADVLKEVQEAKARLKDSTMNLIDVVKGTAGVEAQFETASLKLSALRQRLRDLDAQIDSPLSPGLLQSEKDLLTKMAAKEEALVQDRERTSALRSMNNSIEMHRGSILAASRNLKFDQEEAEDVRAYGDALMAGVEAARQEAKNKALKMIMSQDLVQLAQSTTLSAQSASAVREAAGHIESLSVIPSSSSSTGVEPPSSLFSISQQLSSISAKYDDFEQQLTTTSQMDVALDAMEACDMQQIAPVRQPPVAVRYLLPVRSRASLVASASGSRKIKTRRSSVGPRRSGAHASSRTVNKVDRCFSNGSISDASAAVAAPKKSFRWADEAGEGALDDQGKRAAAEAEFAATSSSSVLSDSNNNISSDATMTTTTISLPPQSGVQQGEYRVDAAAPAEWEDVKRSSTSDSSGRGTAPKRDGLFQRNFLVKRETGTKQDDADSSMMSESSAGRLPLAELSMDTSSNQSSDDLSLLGIRSDLNAASIRSSPYQRRRPSDLGSARRKTRSSFSELDEPLPKKGGARLATGPPSFTASRSNSRMSSNGSSHNSNTNSHNTNQTIPPHARTTNHSNVQQQQQHSAKTLTTKRSSIFGSASNSSSSSGTARRW